MEPVVRARSLHGFPELVGVLHGDSSEVCSAALIRNDVACEEDTWVSFRSVLSAYEIAANSTKCPQFGLKLAYERALSYLGPLLLIFRNAQDLRSAMAATSRFLGIQNRGCTLALNIADEMALWELRLSRPLRKIADQWVEESLLTALNCVRLFAGESYVPKAVKLRHAPVSKLSVYKRYFGRSPQFGASADALGIDLATLDVRNPCSDAELMTFMTEYLETRIFRRNTNTIDTVRAMLRDLIPTGHFSVDIVADQLGLHRRTLQRQLDIAGTTYMEVLDECRSKMALDYLRTSTLPLVNLAYLLGYADQSAFNHAFHRWYAMSPSEWQDQYQDRSAKNKLSR